MIAYIAITVNFVVALMMFEKENYLLAMIPLLTIVFILLMEHLVEQYRKNKP